MFISEMKMRVFVLFFSAWLCCCEARSARAPVEPQRFYHDAVGFELAAKIKASEEAFLERLAPAVDNNRASIDEDGDVRIVGGAIAPANSYPYLAGLVITFVNIAGQSACGSSLISANRLVTAAHCWFDGRNQGRQFEVVLGSQFLFFGGTRIPTSTVFMHPQWVTWPLINDVAIIYLPYNVLFSSTIQPIALPSGSQLQNSFAGQWASAAGYGRTSDQQAGITQWAEISHVNLQVISVGQCQQVFGFDHVRESTICTSGAGFVGICGGDSGGPLVVNQNGQNILVGISSFVNGNGCQLGSPSAFARVTSFNSFIQQHMW